MFAPPPSWKMFKYTTEIEYEKRKAICKKEYEVVRKKTFLVLQYYINIKLNTHFYSNMYSKIV